MSKRSVALALTGVVVFLLGAAVGSQWPRRGVPAGTIKPDSQALDEKRASVGERYWRSCSDYCSAASSPPDAGASSDACTPWATRCAKVCLDSATMIGLLADGHTVEPRPDGGYGIGSLDVKIPIPEAPHPIPVPEPERK